MCNNTQIDLFNRCLEMMCFNLKRLKRDMETKGYNLVRTMDFLYNPYIVTTFSQLFNSVITIFFYS